MDNFDITDEALSNTPFSEYHTKLNLLFPEDNYFVRFDENMSRICAVFGISREQLQSTVNPFIPQLSLSDVNKITDALLDASED